MEKTFFDGMIFRRVMISWNKMAIVLKDTNAEMLLGFQIWVGKQ